MEMLKQRTSKLYISTVLDYIVVGYIPSMLLKLRLVFLLYNVIYIVSSYCLSFSWITNSKTVPKNADIKRKDVLSFANVPQY